MLDDDDAQLALTCCYELHYESFADVDDAWEWAPELLDFRGRLERWFSERIEDETGTFSVVPAGDVPSVLREIIDADGPSLSGYMLEQGTIDEMREFCVHRSEYQLKEADPHTWMIPRLRGRAKAAAVAIQYDEYGEGVADAMHAELFAGTMEGLSLDPTYAAYRDFLPGTTLATGNLVSMLGLHRDRRAACIGHLAVFEMTSVTPMQRYSAALERLGASRQTRRFYDVHVEADKRHETIALDELVAGMLEHEPDVGTQILFGARALMLMERRMAERLIRSWERRSSSLLAPVPDFGAVGTMGSRTHAKTISPAKELIP